MYLLKTLSLTWNFVIFYPRDFWYLRIRFKSLAFFLFDVRRKGVYILKEIEKVV